MVHKLLLDSVGETIENQRQVELTASLQNAMNEQQFLVKNGFAGRFDASFQEVPCEGRQMNLVRHNQGEDRMVMHVDFQNKQTENEHYAMLEVVSA